MNERKLKIYHFKIFIYLKEYFSSLKITCRIFLGVKTKIYKIKILNF